MGLITPMLLRQAMDASLVMGDAIIGILQVSSRTQRIPNLQLVGNLLAKFTERTDYSDTVIQVTFHYWFP